MKDSTLRLAPDRLCLVLAKREVEGIEARYPVGHGASCRIPSTVSSVNGHDGRTFKAFKSTALLNR
jgi:hypothetical protein